MVVNSLILPPLWGPRQPCPHPPSLCTQGCHLPVWQKEAAWTRRRLLVSRSDGQRDLWPSKCTGQRTPQAASTDTHPGGAGEPGVVQPGAVTPGCFPENLRGSRQRTYWAWGSGWRDAGLRRGVARAAPPVNGLTCAPVQGLWHSRLRPLPATPASHKQWVESQLLSI